MIEEGTVVVNRKSDKQLAFAWKNRSDTYASNAEVNDAGKGVNVTSLKEVRRNQGREKLIRSLDSSGVLQAAKIDRSKA